MTTHLSRSRSRFFVLIAIGLTFLFGAAACGSSDDGGATGNTTGTAADGSAALATAATLRLGYFPNVTHAPAIIGVEEGFIEAALGDTKLETTTFSTGNAAVDAIFAGELDASFIGPNPAINAFARSNGEAVRIVSGSTSGGAFFVTTKDITESSQLEGKRIATPSLGNTQDVALRAWLAEEGYETTTAGGGDVSIVPLENADTLTAFIEGEIDGAWVPEPWATRLIQEGDGHVFLDERDLWPDGKFVTTHLLVATEFLDRYPGTVKALIQGELEALEFIAENSDEAKRITNEGIERITDRALPQHVIDVAWENLEFTYDPVAGSLSKSAEDAIEAGLLDPVDLEGIYALDILNELLRDAGQPEVEGL